MAEVSFGDASFDEPIAGFMYESGAYWHEVWPEGPDHYAQKVSAPGRDGSDTVSFGFRGRHAAVDVWYVASDAAACLALVAADETVYGQLVDVDLAGIQIPNCWVLPWTTLQSPRDTGYDTTAMLVRWQFEQHAQAAS